MPEGLGRRSAGAAVSDRERALRAQVEDALRGGRPAEVVSALVALTEEVGDSLYYFARLAILLEGMGRLEEAIGHYRRLIENCPGLAAAHFNVALLYRKNRQYPQALAAYEQALELGIENPAEVLSNMGVLHSEMRNPRAARQMFERALATDAAWVPAAFNLAGLLEETGEKEQALALYRRILDINPRHWEALSRLAYATRITPADQELVERLEEGTGEAADDPLGRESLYFALGKARDDLGQYESAFAAYRSANELGKRRNPPYDRRVMAQLVDRLIHIFNADWLAKSGTNTDFSPIFICGMFRSGSTLVEQLLASHPGVTAGGELEALPWLLGRRLTPYPQRAAGASPEQLAELANEYVAMVDALFPGAARVTDKLPDNFLHLGLIRAMFPKARIVYTRRDPLDNCLSLYFQQLGGNLYYATDLENIAHYYLQHRRLMQHWLQLMGSVIFTVDYDELVKSPQPVLERLLRFLGLEWDDACLAFPQAGAPVRTASVWQVREDLHTRSSGRWINYAPFIDGLRAALEETGAGQQ